MTLHAPSNGIAHTASGSASETLHCKQSQHPHIQRMQTLAAVVDVLCCPRRFMRRLPPCIREPHTPGEPRPETRTAVRGLVACRHT